MHFFLNSGTEISEFYFSKIDLWIDVQFNLNGTWLVQKRWNISKKQESVKSVFNQQFVNKCSSGLLF